MVWRKFVIVEEGSPVLQKFSPMQCSNELLHWKKMQDQKFNHCFAETVYFHMLEYKNHNYSLLSNSPFLPGPQALCCQALASLNYSVLTLVLSSTLHETMELKELSH